MSSCAFGAQKSEAISSFISYRYLLLAVDARQDQSLGWSELTAGWMWNAEVVRCKRVNKMEENMSDGWGQTSF